jgi:phosphoribosylanthranilate isomerase
MAMLVKICGLTRETDLDAAIAAGADMVGFNFFPPSPRAVMIERAAELAARVPEGVVKVALSVDADDELLGKIAETACADMMQLHGHEPPERVVEVRRRFGLEVMKALPIFDADDVHHAHAYETVADCLLFDAKPPKGATRPGGNAIAFDWRLIVSEKWSKPWLLAGGLTPENVAEAIAVSGAPAVDVSTGVEDAPGIKSADKIRRFIAAAKAAENNANG